MVMTRHALSIALLASLALFQGGCLKRTISITTEPPGALVWLNDVEVGRTPLETDFTFYGTYDVRLHREGYEPILTKMKAVTPVQELPVIDLAAEAIPVTFHNVVRWHWDLEQVAERTGNTAAAEAGVLARARELRETARGSAETPAEVEAPEQK